MFEALKGLLVLAVGFYGLNLRHKDIHDVAEHWIHRLHLGSDAHLSRVFLEAADKVTDRGLWTLAAVAIVYSTARFAEAYGLWHGRVWAEWFAVLSSAFYLPWEIMELARRPTLLRLAILVGNLVIVIYVLRIRLQAQKEARAD